MRAALFGKRRADGVQDWENRIAFSGEQDFEHLLKTAVPLVRPLVRRMKRRLPRNFEADDLESVAVTGLFAAARNYRALQDGDFVGYAIPRIRGAILDELRRLPRTTYLESRRLDSAIAKLESEHSGMFDEPE
jgi:RNA polymerase sigma factor FliA